MQLTVNRQPGFLNCDSDFLSLAVKQLFGRSHGRRGAVRGTISLDEDLRSLCFRVKLYLWSALNAAWMSSPVSVVFLSGALAEQAAGFVRRYSVLECFVSVDRAGIWISKQQ